MISLVAPLLLFLLVCQLGLLVDKCLAAIVAPHNLPKGIGSGLADTGVWTTTLGLHDQLVCWAGS